MTIKVGNNFHDLSVVEKLVLDDPSGWIATLLTDKNVSVHASNMQSFTILTVAQIESFVNTFESPIIPPPLVIIITMIGGGGAIGYMTSKLRGVAIMGKTQIFKTAFANKHQL